MKHWEIIQNNTSTDTPLYSINLTQPGKTQLAAHKTPAISTITYTPQPISRIPLSWLNTITTQSGISCCMLQMLHKHKQQLIVPVVLAALTCNPTAAAQRFTDSELNALLKNDCGSCHGLTLKGGLGPPLLPDTLQNKTDAYLLTVIQYGIPNTAMPAWNGILNRDEITRLIQQLRENAKEETHAEKKP